jgi:hypothetical protein
VRSCRTSTRPSWEGHGFDTATTHIAWQGPLDDETRLALEQERYYLLAGPVAAATQLQDPGSLID